MYFDFQPIMRKITKMCIKCMEWKIFCTNKTIGNHSDESKLNWNERKSSIILLFEYNYMEKIRLILKFRQSNSIDLKY